MGLAKSHRDLEVYQMAFKAAMEIFELSKKFPKEETYSLTDQIRRSSRSVNTNIAEAWRKRKYPLVFRNKLSDAEAEAGETQSWLEFAHACQYLTTEEVSPVYKQYDLIIGKLVVMGQNPDSWNPEKSSRP